MTSGVVKEIFRELMKVTAVSRTRENQKNM